MKQIIRKLQNRIINPIRVIGKTKIFCIGRNKTGTTSIKKAAEDLGFIVGHQGAAELLFKDYLKRDFSGLIDYCRTAQFFQDVPFSLPYTYQILDYAFPDSKFILSVRDSAEQWYDSLIKFQTKIHGQRGELPDKNYLLLNKRVFEGFSYWTKNDVYRTPDHDLFNKELLINHYLRYIEEVQHFFRFKKNLIVVNVKVKDDYKVFCDFLGREPKYDSFPWENKTE